MTAEERQPPSSQDHSRLLTELIKIGISLTSERDLVALPTRILTAARRFTRAEAGTIYLRDGDRLRFTAVQNDVLERRLEKSEMRRLFQSDLLLTQSSLAGYVALSRDILRVPDAYEIPTDRPYKFNRAIDAQTGYRTRSVLVVPFMEPTGYVVGVFQLINARDARNQIVPFDPDDEELIRALASLASVAVRNAQLEELACTRATVRVLTDLVTTIAHEIDTPLFVITEKARLLIRRMSDPVSHQSADAVLGAAETIREIVQRLNRIAELKLADQLSVEERWSR